jgi:hypothetical protein
MGNNKLTRLHLYWSPLMVLEKFCRITVMTLKRFCLLWNNLHITNNLERPSVRTNFTKCFLCWIVFVVDAKLEVEQHVAVDEQMISFKGRHSC